MHLPGEGVSTEVSNLQGPAKLNALWDLRNICRRKREEGGGVSVVDAQMWIVKRADAIERMILKSSS